MVEEIDRETFAARQAEMTAIWYRNVQNQESDVAAYIKRRQDAYLDRWREAARFAPRGSRILDLGGGNMYPALFEFIKKKEFDYHYTDVDPSAVGASRLMGANYGFASEKFRRGFNDRIEYPNEYFDSIFSSHCVEHSFSLRDTLYELNRILRHSGNIMIAVPLGWDDNPEHPYFFDVDHWQAMIVDAGFTIRVAQVGIEYADWAHDLFVSARKVGPPRQPRIDPDDYRKANFNFETFASERVRVEAPSTSRGDKHMIVKGGAWQIEVDLPPEAKEALVIFARHEWSGKVQLRWGNNYSYEDLYSWYGLSQPVRVFRGGASNTVMITGSGRNEASRGSECVMCGFYWR